MDDKVEKPFKPYKINIGKMLGRESLEVEVVPEEHIVGSGALHVCACATEENKNMAAIVPGSIIVKASCGHDVWIAPSGQRISAQGKNSIFCTECFMQLFLKKQANCV